MTNALKPASGSALVSIPEEVPLQPKILTSGTNDNASRSYQQAFEDNISRRLNSVAELSENDKASYKLFSSTARNQIGKGGLFDRDPYNIQGKLICTQVLSPRKLGS